MNGFFKNVAAEVIGVFTAEPKPVSTCQAVQEEDAEQLRETVEIVPTVNVPTAVAEPVVGISERESPPLDPGGDSSEHEEGHRHNNDSAIASGQTKEILAKLEDLSAEMTAFARKTGEVENLSHTVEQQMEIIRDSSRRMRELDERAVFENVVKPMIGGLMLLHDSVTTHRRALQAGGVVDCGVALDGIASEILEMLARYGVKPMSYEGVPFDPKKHKVVDTVPEYLPRENEIVEIKRDGFEMDGKVIRAQEVVIVKKAK